MDAFEKNLRELFPGPSNRALRALVRAARGSPWAIRSIKHRVALTYSGTSKLETLAAMSEIRETLAVLAQAPSEVRR